MKLMTWEDGQRWLQSAQIKSYRAGRLDLPDARKAYSLSKDSGDKTALARLLTYGVFDQKPIVLILLETDIWPSSANEFLFIKYREAVSPGQNLDHRPFNEYTYHFTEAAEAAEMEGLLALCLYFIWEVILFDESGEIFIKISHDEWMEVGSTDAGQFQEAVTLLDDFGLDIIS